MEIIITPRKYINAPAPEITETMLDWLFHTMWSTRFEDRYKKVDKIEIFAEIAYKGSSTIHFYISINDDYKNRYHKQWIVGLNTHMQNPRFGTWDENNNEVEYETTWTGIRKERWEWMLYFIRNGVDMGKDGIQAEKKINSLIKKHKKIEKLKEIEQNRQRRYGLYLKLKEEFE